MNFLFSVLNFLATGPGMLVTGLLATAIILAWEWRTSLICLVVVQFGVAAVAIFRQSIDIQWITVQTLTIVLCALILSLSVTQISGSPTSRQSGNGLLRLMIVILLYTSWRLFEINLAIPQIQSDVSVLFVWLGVCALVIMALSDNPLFTGTALLLWLVPMHVVVATLFPFTSLIVLFGVLELGLALCCSFLILAERLGDQEESPILTDITFPIESEQHLLPAFPRSNAGALGTSERTTANLLAVSKLPNRPGSTLSGNQGHDQPEAEPGAKSTERTGDHPIVATLAKGKRSKQNLQSP